MDAPAATPAAGDEEDDSDEDSDAEEKVSSTRLHVSSHMSC
jgi:hypothetical protein